MWQMADFCLCKDVTDLAWAPKDRFLASVGLDAKTIIWDGYNLRNHHSFYQSRLYLTRVSVQKNFESSAYTKVSSKEFVGILLESS